MLNSHPAIRKGAPFENLSMAVFSLNMPFIKQSHNDLQGRLLIHAFGVAAAYAKKMFGVSPFSFVSISIANFYNFRKMSEIYLSR